jgi:hypothetical protein
MMAKWIKPNAVVDVEPIAGKEFTLPELQWLCGGEFEIVPTNDPLFALCIKDGNHLLAGNKYRDADFNAIATSMISQLELLVFGNVVVGSLRELGCESIVGGR